MKLALTIVFGLVLAPVAWAGVDSFTQPFPFLSRESRRAFFTGNSFFNENWVAAPASAAARDGLGPLFQARSCSACHGLDGRGLPPAGPEETLLGLLVRVGTEPQGHPIYGTQISPLAVPGAMPEARVAISWQETPGKHADGTPYSLRRPVVRFDNWSNGEISPETPISLRLAPAVFGGGLLENLPLATLEQWADPEDKDGDGISGKIARHAGGKIGRFGWKANAVDLPAQTAAAFLLDMGLRTPMHPQGDLTPTQEKAFAQLPNGGNPEVSQLIFDRVVHYLRALAPPPARQASKAADLGNKLFTDIQCAACHRPEANTGSQATLPELANRPFAAYTDLLLHDMGPELADGRQDGPATGSEWKTPPLWGLGLHAKVTGSVALLHDGRARNAEEAILWHGGEAEKSRDLYRKLTAEQRGQLLAFLDTL